MSDNTNRNPAFVGQVVQTAGVLEMGERVIASPSDLPIVGTDQNLTFALTSPQSLSVDLPHPASLGTVAGGRKIRCFDKNGDWGANPVTFNGTGGALLDGVPSVTVSQPFGGVVWEWRGTYWHGTGINASVPQPVLLGQLGPDIIGGGFGSANWINGAFVGTYTAGFGSALGSAVLCGGYVAQTDEVIEQITVSSWTGPSAASTIHIHVQPAGGAFADTLQTITVGLGATETYYTTPLVLNQGDKVAFELDVADPVWSVFASGISLYGLRRAA